MYKELNWILNNLPNGGGEVTNKKWFILTTLLICLITLSTLIWVNNHKIIDGNYNKITITNMGRNTTDVIENKEEINKIINHINDSPRTFNPNRGFRYDNIPHAILIFESDKEKVSLGFVIPKGNALTKYWEIETNFEFVKDME